MLAREIDTFVSNFNKMVKDYGQFHIKYFPKIHKSLNYDELHTFFYHFRTKICDLGSMEQDFAKLNFSVDFF